MKSIRYLSILICLTAVVSLLSGCSTSGRTGFGPYDTTDYGSLEAREELREFHMEQTMEAKYGGPDDFFDEPDYDPYDYYDPPEEFYRDSD